MALIMACSASRLHRIPYFMSGLLVPFRQLTSASPHGTAFGRLHAPFMIQCALSSSTTPTAEDIQKQDADAEKVELACPVCHQPVIATGSQGISLVTINGNSFRCQSCRKSYRSNGGIIDLTIPTEGRAPLGSSFFQIPLIAYIYERGYREMFRFGNFPGFDEEAQRAMDILEPARGDVIMDLSCGPGGFTRRFLTSGEYETVIASDFSEAMLEQCRGFLESDTALNLDNVVLVRADAARLPFTTSSLAGIHAAAAIHCWPNVQSSVAEIMRVLRPGGVFVASTFIPPTPPGLDEPLKPLRQTLDQLQLQFNWFAEADLKSLVESCGFTNWQSYRRGVYILFSATKPM